MSTVKGTTAQEGVFAQVERSKVISDYPVHVLTGYAKQPEGPVAAAMAPGMGVSLSFEGLKNDAAMATFTLVSDTTDAGDPEHPRRTVTLANQDKGLSLTVTYTYYPKHQAVLIGGTLRNTSESPVRRVTELRSFNLGFDVHTMGDPTVHTIGGGITHFFFPPLAFQLDERRLMGSLRHPFRIDSGGTGRSSDKNMPFFHVEDGSRSWGIYGGFEWSGLWHIDFERDNEVFWIRGGIEETDLTLRPGETIELPRAMVGFYKGDIHAGRNALRRFIRDWYPRWQGQDLGAPVSWNHAFTFEARITDEIFRRQVPVCADLGFDWMQIDWGWYAGCIPPMGMTHGIGNWTTVEPTRFPNGIEPLADLVRSYGMKYCTWVDPEQAHPSSTTAQEHPEWMLYVPNKTMGLVDFGRKDVQDYFIELLSGLIHKWGVHKLKWDNNIDPAQYWRLHESPEHRGLMQMKHIRGVYFVWDELRRLNPTLVLENCSSGGRRFDLGSFGHAHVHHGSDFNFENNIIRTQISGVNTVMPTYRVIHTCTWGGPQSPDMYFQSRFGGILRFSQDFASWPPEALAKAKKHISVYKSIRHLLKEDFYALFPQPRRLEDWDGWQFHAPATGEGFVMVFRMQGEDASCSPRLRGLRADATYELRDPYSGERLTLSGATLVKDGLPVTIEQNTAKLWHYKQA